MPIKGVSTQYVQLYLHMARRTLRRARNHTWPGFGLPPGMGRKPLTTHRLPSLSPARVSPRPPAPTVALTLTSWVTGSRAFATRSQPTTATGATGNVQEGNTEAGAVFEVSRARKSPPPPHPPTPPLKRCSAATRHSPFEQVKAANRLFDVSVPTPGFWL